MVPANNPLFTGIADRQASSALPSTVVPLSSGLKPTDGSSASAEEGTNLDTLSRSAQQLKQAHRSDLKLSRAAFMQDEIRALAAAAATGSAATSGETTPQREDSVIWDTIGISEHQTVTQQGLASYQSSRSAREERTLKCCDSKADLWQHGSIIGLAHLFETVCIESLFDVFSEAHNVNDGEVAYSSRASHPKLGQILSTAIASNDLMSRFRRNFLTFRCFDVPTDHILVCFCSV